VPAYRLDIPPQVAEIIWHLSPAMKRPIKSSLQALSDNPALGEPLMRELEGLWKYRVRRFRIVVAMDRGSRVLRIFTGRDRRTVYELVAMLIRAEGG
jgi:mRNA interferase RelE/StbE